MYMYHLLTTYIFISEWRSQAHLSYLSVVFSQFFAWQTTQWTWTVLIWHSDPSNTDLHVPH